MMPPGALAPENWRVFRLWLTDVEDDSLLDIRSDADMEHSHRIERDRGISRLFFTSLSDADLAIARKLSKLIENEVAARHAVETSAVDPQRLRALKKLRRHIGMLIKLYREDRKEIRQRSGGR